MPGRLRHTPWALEWAGGCACEGRCPTAIVLSSRRVPHEHVLCWLKELAMECQNGLLASFFYYS
jgi:hypothetical protein